MKRMPLNRLIQLQMLYSFLGIMYNVGSLEPGKFADFTILEGDPYDFDPAKLKDIPVWGTALAGKLYKSDR